MNKIKVIYVSHSSLIAGGELMLLSLVKYLNRDVFEPVVVLPAEGPLLEEFKQLDVRTYVSPLEWWIMGSVGSIPPAGEALACRTEALAHILRVEEPALVQTNTSVVWEGALAARLTGVPHVWNITEILEGHPGLRPLFPLPLVRWLMDTLSERVVAVSEAVKGPLAAHVGPEKLVTIYYGIDTDRLRVADGPPLREELGLPADVPLAVTVGMLGKEKGHNLLVEAAALVKKAGANIKFLIAGGGSPCLVRALAGQIEALGVRDTVYLLGFRSDIPRILQSSDFMILPSLTESFSLVILEAMAARKPVVATACGGPSEIVLDGETGFLVPVNDPQSLAEKTLELAGDSVRRREMGERGFRRFSETFSAESCAASYERVYREIIGGEGAPACTDKERALLLSFMQVYQGLRNKVDCEQNKLDCEQKLAAVASSTSWRVTKPLRWVADLARR